MLFKIPKSTLDVVIMVVYGAFRVKKSNLSNNNWAKLGK